LNTTPRNGIVVVMPFPIEEEYIRQTEIILGLSFPTSYRMKMLGENGGEISSGDDDWQLFPFLDSSDAKRISRTSNDIVREGKKAMGASGFPPNVTAIGDNGIGDYLVFVQRIDGFLSEEVFAWRHEARRLEKIATSFQELISD